MGSMVSPYGSLLPWAQSATDGCIVEFHPSDGMGRLLIFAEQCDQWSDYDMWLATYQQGHVMTWSGAPPNLSHGCGFQMGISITTHTHISVQVCKSIIFTDPLKPIVYPGSVQLHIFTVVCMATVTDTCRQLVFWGLFQSSFWTLQWVDHNHNLSRTDPDIGRTWPDWLRPVFCG